MANLVDVIQQISHNVIEGASLADFRLGTVESVNPYKIRLNEKMVLTTQHLYMLKSAVGEYPVTTPKANGYCTHDIHAGDTVLLGQFKGGEQYVIMGQVSKL